VASTVKVPTQMPRTIDEILMRYLSFFADVRKSRLQQSQLTSIFGGIELPGHFFAVEDLGLF